MRGLRSEFVKKADRIIAELKQYRREYSRYHFPTVKKADRIIAELKQFDWSYAPKGLTTVKKADRIIAGLKHGSKAGKRKR